MRLFLFLAALAVLLESIAAVPHVTVVDPTSSTLQQGGIVDLGVVGPGQKIEIVVQRQSGEISSRDYGNVEGLWDKLSVIDSSLPQGWSKEDSKFYEKQLKAFVTVAKDATEGDYAVQFHAFNEYNSIPSVDFQGKIRVSKHVFEMSLVKEPVTIGVREQAEFVFKLKNLGSASDSFSLTASGLPKELVHTQSQFIQHNSEIEVPYSFNTTERGEFHVSFESDSLSSSEVNSNVSTFLYVGSGLVGDAKAATNGIMLFPSIEGTVYSLITFVANLFTS